jgi:hypothetical protein
MSALEKERRGMLHLKKAADAKWEKAFSLFKEGKVDKGALVEAIDFLNSVDLSLLRKYGHLDIS